MYHTLAVKVLDSADDTPHELGGISLPKELLPANPVKELTSPAEVGDDVYCAREEDVSVVYVGERGKGRTGVGRLRAPRRKKSESVRR
jgi:hypothetical protein